MDHARECWVDMRIWEKEYYKTKCDESWGWVENIHSTYIPFDYVVLCLEDLTVKYEEE